MQSSSVFCSIIRFKIRKTGSILDKHFQYTDRSIEIDVAHKMHMTTRPKCNVDLFYIYLYKIDAIYMSLLTSIYTIAKFLYDNKRTVEQACNSVQTIYLYFSHNIDHILRVYMIVHVRLFTH